MDRSRRAFLRAIGGAAVAYPMFSLLESSLVRAAGGTAPLNLIVVYHPHGIAAEYWAMQPGDSETSFNITYPGCSLQPLDDAATFGKSFKDKILVIEHLSHISDAGGHSSAATITTGSKITGNASPLNSSIDQFLAVEKGLGANTRVTSLAVGVGFDQTDSGNSLSFGPGGIGLPKIIDPNETFKTLFASLAPTDPAAAAALARQNAVEKSILDFVGSQVQGLKPKLGAAENIKLDQHLESIRQLEKRLSATGAMTCQAPPPPDASKFPSLRRYNGGEPYFDAITDAQIDLVAQGISCGITRFVTLFLADLSYSGNSLMLPSDNHGNVAHAYNASALGSNNTGGPGDTASQQLLAKLNKYYYGKLARLMQKLDSFGALDNTLIYMTSDMGNPALHSTLNTPTVLAGGAAGRFRMGRRLRQPWQCPTTNVWCQETGPDFQATSNNHLLVSIAQAFGVDINQFGTQTDPRHATGALSGLV
ncbi:MAG: DUF1552 domain-containing protein [Myxococcota bacterium]|nr:DUF1552 domain-containing protein [Myxococcota bacterium]